jgi:glutamate-1-semialdehyde 2,1-aminomutase
MNRIQSDILFSKAKQVIPGGVNSPVRAFKSVGGQPIFFKSAKGAYLYDVDDNKYIDYISSWGPMILGHAHPEVIDAIRQTATSGTSFGAPTPIETEMAELICSMASNVDLIRMVSSGTEACMSALRLTRGYTGRDKVVKFEGCYHGHADAFLVKAGSGLATLQINQVPGITAGVANDTLTCAYNDLNQLKSLVAQNKGKVAAIIIEPVAGNMGCILPQPGFLESIREICTAEGILLIFDEVMTGFRLSKGGAQHKLKIDADLVTYGKVIGGGMPVGAFGGRREIMEHIAPIGQVYQAGTLSGNPLAMIAGLTTLRIINETDVLETLDNKASYLAQGLDSVLKKSGIPYQLNHIGSMLSIHFSEEPIIDYASATRADNERFKAYFHYMLDKGIYLPPSPFESWFLNNGLSFEDMDYTINMTESFLKQLTNS